MVKSKNYFAIWVPMYQAKLKGVLEYINGTINLEYILGANSLNKFWTWVDASYPVHPEMKIHPGGIMYCTEFHQSQEEYKKLNQSRAGRCQ